MSVLGYAVIDPKTDTTISLIHGTVARKVLDNWRLRGFIIRKLNRYAYVAA